MNNKSTPAGIPCHANQFPCTNCCWQCWKMRHYGILCQPHALHASTWQIQKQTAIWPTIAFFRLLSTQQIQALLTLFSKFFSSFPHGTCLLSVSNQYLALDETYHPVCAPISRSVTLETYTVHRGLQTTSRTLTIADALFQEAFICTSIDWTFSDYKSRPTALISMLSLSLFIRHY